MIRRIATTVLVAVGIVGVTTGVASAHEAGHAAKTSSVHRAVGNFKLRSLTSTKTCHIVVRQEGGKRTITCAGQVKPRPGGVFSPIPGD